MRPNSNLRYPFVAVQVIPEDVDWISCELFELGAQGVEEKDSMTHPNDITGDIVKVVASFEKHEAAREAILWLNQHYSSGKAELEEVIGDDWRDAWKEHFKPFSLTSQITVTPPWVDYQAQRPKEKILILEPGRAFGTGLHATTSLVAQLLDENLSSLTETSILDVGTGSGILGLVALKLGASRVLGTDIDEDALLVAQENAQRNHLSEYFKTSSSSLVDIMETFPWVVANIESRVLVPMADDLVGKISTNGRLILSGLLASEESWLVGLYESKGLRFVKSLHLGEASGEAWVAILFESLK